MSLHILCSSFQQNHVLSLFNFFFGIFGNNDGPNIKNDNSNSDEDSENASNGLFIAFIKTHTKIQTSLIVRETWMILGTGIFTCFFHFFGHVVFKFIYNTKYFDQEHRCNNHKDDYKNCQTHVNLHLAVKDPILMKQMLCQEDRNIHCFISFFYFRKWITTRPFTT